MREEGVSVTYQTGMSKSVGVSVHSQPGQWRQSYLWHQSHPLLSWLAAPQRLRQVWLQALRHVQFPFLLLRRSFWGLVLALNWWDFIDEQVLLGGALMFDDLERLRRQS